MKRTLQIILFILSCIPLYFGMSCVIFGAAQHIDAEHVNAALDNQYRYLGAFYLSLTFLIWWMLPHIERHTIPLRLLVFAIFLGGLARLYSHITVGPGLPQQFGGMLLELSLPVLLIFQAKIAREYGTKSALE